jgi:hypothetical protein
MSYETADMGREEVAVQATARGRSGFGVSSKLLQMELKLIRAGGRPCAKCGGEARRAAGSPDHLIALCDAHFQNERLDQQLRSLRRQRDLCFRR